MSVSNIAQHSNDSFFIVMLGSAKISRKMKTAEIRLKLKSTERIYQKPSVKSDQKSRKLLQAPLVMIETTAGN